VKYDREGFVAAVDGTRLFYGIAGSGPAIVLNDGIGCDGFAWTYLLPQLARKHTVLHWHYRGHGRSGEPKDSSRIKVVDLASDLVGLLDQLSLRPVVAIGHSMGTQIALELVRLAPKRVSGLVLCCGSYGRVTHTFHGSDMLSNILPRIIAGVQRYRGVARGIWGRLPSGIAWRIAKLSGEVDTLAIREEDFRKYLDHVALMDPDLFLAMLQEAGEHSAEDLLPTLSVPTLVIAAEKDTFTPRALAERMAQTIPGAEIMVLKGASHAAPVEQPAAIAERIEQFLAAHNVG